MIIYKDVQTAKAGRACSFQLSRNTLDGDKIVSPNSLAKNLGSPVKVDDESDKRFKVISKTDLRSINERYSVLQGYLLT